MTETTPRREATRRRLIEAAISEFASRGIDATSVEHLCDAAGFTRGAFYSNFATKDDLCLAIMEQHRDQIIDGLSQVFFEPATTGDVDWAIREALPEFFAILGPTDAYRITLLEIRLRATRFPDLQTRVAEFAAETTPIMEGFLTRLADQLGVRFRLPVNKALAIMESVFFHETLHAGFDQPTMLIETALALVDRDI